jgi:RNA polymerase sporulation-specific sigma factor
VKTKLIEDNMGLVYSLIHREYPQYINDEDIVQSGMLGLCKAAERWDESKSKFSNYAWHCIRNAIVDEFKQRATHQGVLSLDYEVDGVDGDRVPFGSFIVGQEDVGYVDTDVDLEQLTPIQLKVFELYRNGYKTKEIASTLGVSRQCVCQTMRRVRLLRGYRGSFGTPRKE